MERDYVRYSLGSTAMLVDSIGTVTDFWTYWPYGEIRTRTGTRPTSLTLVKSLGYFAGNLKRLYITARHFLAEQGRWLTADSHVLANDAGTAIGLAHSTSICSKARPPATVSSCLIDGTLVLKQRFQSDQEV